MKQTKILSKIELCNLFGLNVLRHIKDRDGRKQRPALACMIGLVVVFMAVYIGAISYVLIGAKAADVVPMFLTTMSSIFVLMLSIFKASGVIFRNKGYEIISSLPVTKEAVVMSRFVRLYVEGFLVTMLVMMPGLVIYAVLLHPAISYYIIGAVAVFVTPLFPVALATGIGALITGIASRMKYKGLVEAAISVLIVIGLFLWAASFQGQTTTLTQGNIRELVEPILAVVEKMYPLAVMVGDAMLYGNYMKLVLFVLISAIVFVGVVMTVAANFHGICRKLYSISAKHDYKLERLEKNAVWKALVKREAKRYFASGAYVTNTIIGPALAIVFCVGILFVDMDSMLAKLPIQLNVTGALPFIVAGIMIMMNPASSSVSMEGKEWWIVKSLPLTAQNILDGKILFSLCLVTPFYVVAEMILMMTQKISMVERIWFIIIPFLFLVFACVFGIAVNLKFPKLDWESEVSVVKQSASSMLGGLGGMIVAIIAAYAVLMVPVSYAHLIRAIICVLLIVVTVWLYGRNNRVDLRNI